MKRLQNTAKLNMKGMLIVCALFALCFGSNVVADIYTLVTYNTAAFTDVNGGTNYLANGSIIYIMGSYDAKDGGFPPYGGGYLANEAQGDDVVLGSAVISGEEGLFESILEYDSTQVKYVYLRVFDSIGPESAWVGGTNMYWGVSDPALLSPNFGVAEVEIGAVSTTNTAEFYVIPEPGVASILCFIFAVTIGVSRSVNSKRPMAKKHLRT